MSLLPALLPEQGVILGIFGALFGRSSSKQFKKTQDALAGQVQPLLNQGRQGLDAYYGALGIGDAQSFNQGFDRFKQSSGYRTVADEAMRGVTGSAAARGLLSSGSALRALQDRSGQMAQQTYGNYLQQLMQGSQTSLNAGMAAAGQIDKGAKPGVIGQIGQAAGTLAKLGVFSDRRLKTDITRIGRYVDGLGIYKYRYKGSDTVQVGVMADEVARLRPYALGASFAGYATVHYDQL